MNPERDQNKNRQQQSETTNDHQHKQHSSAFNESNRGDEKSTHNVEDEAELEQQRKDALTERD